ncbi:MAG: T9SS type A sorting domain-containing protein, partial [Candidatus Syntrophosphaera sp.]|nr:T9SS type A sorting domain-containing protein [Candidatus Syntrophosphaera sp.]
NERVWDGDGDGIAVIDKGAYEYQPLFAPVNLSAQQSGANVYLSWEMPVYDRSLSGYRVYRNGCAYSQIGDPAHLTFRDHITQSDTLSYHVVALYGNVESPPSNEVIVYMEIVAISDETNPPDADFLLIHPNPFIEFTILRLGLARAAEVRIDIYNLRGQKVKTISEGKLDKGEHVLWWNADDDSGTGVSSGIYLCRVFQNNVLKQIKRISYIK